MAARSRDDATSDRRHDRESPSRGQRRKRGEKNQAIGISRGGRSTKIHAIVDSKGRPLNFTVTGGQVHDNQVVGEVLDMPRSPLAVTADKNTTARKSASRSRMKALPVIPSRSNATKKGFHCPKRFYRRRLKIENYFCRKTGGASPARYDKLARNFLAAATLVGALYWIEVVVQTLGSSLRPALSRLRQVCVNQQKPRGTKMSRQLASVFTWQ